MRILRAARPARCAAALGLIAALGFAPDARAVSTSFDFSGFTLPDDDSGIEPDVTITFTWDAFCTLSCTLQIDMIYNDTNGAGALESQAHGLAGVSWDEIGSITYDPNASRVIAPTLVGPQAATAMADLPDLTIGAVSGDDVSPHWAFRDNLFNAADPNIPVSFDPMGDSVLSSVGDVTFGVTVMGGATGMTWLLPGTPSSVEPNPTDGIPFGIVEQDTTTLNGAKGNVVFAQNSSSGFLRYDGQLDGIENVAPLFGTDGVVIPEPGSLLLLGLGLAGLSAVRRSRSR